MTPDVILQLVLGLGVVPGLFVWLLFDTRKEHREQLDKSQERERQLMEHIAKSDEALNNVSASITKVSENFERMERNISYMQKDIERLKQE